MDLPENNSVVFRLLRGSLLAMGAFMMVQLTLFPSIHACTLSGLDYKLFPLCLSGDGSSDVLAAYGAYFDGPDSVRRCSSSSRTLTSPSWSRGR